MTKDPDAAFFKKLDGLQPCEIAELKGGDHVFAVYGHICPILTIVFSLCFCCNSVLTIAAHFIGDNFFKSASYTIEAVCAQSFEEASMKLKHIEANLLLKRDELHQFEKEYKKVRVPFRANCNKQW